MTLTSIFEAIDRRNGPTAARAPRHTQPDRGANGKGGGAAPPPTAHRPWSPPRRPWVMHMTWLDLLFAHWPVDPANLRPLVPPSLDIDTFDGVAWIGIVPFRMTGIRPRFCPPVPRLSAFAELNVRTYVTHGGKPGVWFLSLDAERRLAVTAARRVYHLNYQFARISCESNADGAVNYRSTRGPITTGGNVWTPDLDQTAATNNSPGSPASFIARYRPVAEPFAAHVGTLEHFLTERYCLYAADRRGTIYRGDIDHHPWPLCRAEANIELNTMTDPLGIALTGPPHLLFAHRIATHIWTAERV